MSHLVRFKSISVLNVLVHLVSHFLALIGWTGVDISFGSRGESVTVDVSFFITGYTGFSVQTGYSGVKHLVCHTGRRCQVVFL